MSQSITIDTDQRYVIRAVGAAAGTCYFAGGQGWSLDPRQAAIFYSMSYAIEQQNQLAHPPHIETSVCTLAEALRDAKSGGGTNK